MTDLIDIEATRVRFNGGQFDSNFRYIQTAATGTVSSLLKGPSLAIGTAIPTFANVFAWRFTVGGYNVRGYYGGSSFAVPSAPATVANTATAFFL